MTKTTITLKKSEIIEMIEREEFTHDLMTALDEAQADAREDQDAVLEIIIKGDVE